MYKWRKPQETYLALAKIHISSCVKITIYHLKFTGSASWDYKVIFHPGKSYLQDQLPWVSENG